MSPLLQLPRDDRLFVMNLRKGWVTETGRTTEYVKWHEPQTPLASLNGQPMFSDDDVDKWERWKAWLDQQGLESCLTGKVHLPHWAKG